MRKCSNPMTPWFPMTLMMNSMAHWARNVTGQAACQTKPSQSAECRTGSARTSKEKQPDRVKDLVETAVGAGTFNRLAEALTAADLVATLKGEGPFTVFAPADEAFAQLPAEQLDAALKDAALLRTILTGHVVPGRYRASDLKGIDSLRTVGGTPLKVDLSEGVRIGTAKVVQADVEASNGIIHVIDSVLLPAAQ